MEQDGVKHYCLVKNLSRLMALQVSKHDGKKKHFCLRCLNSFWCQEALIKHQEYCGKKEAVKIKMPKKGTMLTNLNIIINRERFPLLYTPISNVLLNR